MAKPLLKAGKNPFFIPRLDVNDLVRWQAGLRQRWGKHIVPGNTPQDGTAASCSYPCRKQGRRRPMARAASAARDLMQCTEFQPATWQMAVHDRHAEWQNA